MLSIMYNAAMFFLVFFVSHLVAPYLVNKYLKKEEKASILVKVLIFITIANSVVAILLMQSAFDLVILLLYFAMAVIATFPLMKNTYLNAYNFEIRKDIIVENVSECGCMLYMAFAINTVNSLEPLIGKLPAFVIIAGIMLVITNIANKYVMKSE